MKKMIIALLLLSTSVFADGLKMENLNVSKVAFKFGLTKPSDVDSVLSFGAVVPLGNLYADYGFGASLDYWSKSMGARDFSDIALGLRACKKLAMIDLMGKKAKVYAGAGVALHFLKKDVDASVIGDESDTSTKLGLDAFGGVGFPLTKKIHLKGEVGYRLVSDISQLQIGGAIVYNFK